MKFLLITCIGITLVACDQNKQTRATWSSKYRELSFKYGSPWKLLSGMEMSKKTLAGVIDQTDGTSYLIQLGDDVSKERLSDAEYYEGTRNTMLSANSSNRLVLEDDTIYHGMKAHRQVFVLVAKRWGTINHITYIIRNGQEYLSVQISYPYSKQKVIGRLPENLASFDETVQLKMK